MMKNALVICAGLALSASAFAGPDFAHKGKQAADARPATTGVSILDVDISDNFDSYANGSALGGQGLWKTWWSTAGVDATVTNTSSNSAPNSMRYMGSTFSDMVIEPEFTAGVITFTCMTFAPGNTGQASDAFIIGLNDYVDNGGGAGTANWSLQTQFHPTFGIVVHQANANAQLPIILDKWVEHKAVIDLENNTLDVFYDGAQLGATVTWYNDGVNPNTNSLATGTVKKFDAIDMYSNGFDGFLVDDLVLDEDAGGCYADCDGSGSLDFFDFLCFQNEFAAGNSYADCDNSGGLDFFDFLCFQNEFAAGCP